MMNTKEWFDDRSIAEFLSFYGKYGMRGINDSLRAIFQTHDVLVESSEK